MNMARHMLLLAHQVLLLATHVLLLAASSYTSRQLLWKLQRHMFWMQHRCQGLAACSSR
jgi:hypothetical protein